MHRNEIVAAVLQGLQARPARAQLLIGPSGIGKTTVATQVAAALESTGQRVIPVVALAELSDVPLAALAPVLSLSGSDTDALADRVQRLLHRVGSAGNDHVLVIDDAPLLDDQSAAVVYQLVRVFGVPVLMTARTEHRITGPIQRLLHEHLVTTTTVPALARDEVGELLQRYLADTVRPDSLRTLHHHSGGNPLLLRELVWSAQRDGRVQDGPYGLEIEPGDFPEHLLGTVQRTIDTLSADARALAALLAVAQPLPEPFAAAYRSEALSELQRHSVASILQRADRSVVMLSHPLYAEALLQATTPAELQQVRFAAIELLRSSHHADDRFMAACLLEQVMDLAEETAPGPAELDEIDWAAARAYAAGDAVLALRLATTSLRARPNSYRAALVAGTAQSALGNAEAAEAAFTDAMAAAGSDHDRAIAALRWGQHLAYRRRDVSAALELVEEQSQQLNPEATKVLEADVAKWRMMLGDQQGLLTTPADPTTSDPTTLVGQSIGAAMFSTMLGDSDAARHAIARARPFLTETEAAIPHAASLLDLSEFLTHVSDGDIATATDFAERQRVSGPVEAAGIWSYTLALIAMHGGAPRHAADLAALSIRQLEWRDVAGMAGAAAALASSVAASLHASSADAGPKPSPLLGDAASSDIKVALHLAEADLWSAAPAGRADAAAALATTCAQALEFGHHVVAALTASVAIRCGHAAAVTEVLTVAAAMSPSPLVADIASAARLLASPPVPESAAAEVAADAFDLVARLRSAGMAALGRAVALAAPRSDAVPELLRRKLALVLAELDQHCGPEPGVTEPRTLHGVRLTEREWRIAEAASRRLRSREIAALLDISVRTVDNHLAHIYRKLNVNTRDQLATVFADEQPSDTALQRR